VSGGEQREIEPAVTRALVEEVLRTAIALEEIVDALLGSLAPDAFPGEEPARVLLEMLVGSAHPAARAAGARECRTATALVAAIRERVLTDLHTAAERAERRR
jgi:hypothetical protein